MKPVKFRLSRFFIYHESHEGHEVDIIEDFSVLLPVLHDLHGEK